MALKNGLTEQQVNKAKDLFSEINLAAICRENNVNYMNIVNVLRGTNKDIASFNKVVIAAQSQVDERKKALESLPL